MDGREQTVYLRKNWSSLILFNCGHEANAVLTPDLANRKTGKYLHRFGWLDDALIGEICGALELVGRLERIAGTWYARCNPLYARWALFR